MTDGLAARLSSWYAEKGPGWKAIAALYTIDLLGIWLSDPLTLVGYLPLRSAISANQTLFLVGTAAFSAGIVLWLSMGQRATRRWIIFYLSLQTASMAFSVFVLVRSLSAFQGDSGGTVLFTDAVVLWVTNILVFALWYWKLDAGGPFHRTGGGKPHPPDILFAQRNSKIPGYEDWCPRYIDYLFLAFTASTEFGPSDTAFLSRRFKVLSMVQACISLSVLAILAARAVNLIH